MEDIIIQNRAMLNPECLFYLLRNICLIFVSVFTTQTSFLVRSSGVEDSRVLFRTQRPLEMLIDRGITNTNATRRSDNGPLSA